MKSQIQELKKQLVASDQMIAQLYQNLQQKEKIIQELLEENQRLQKLNFFLQQKLTLRWKTRNAAVQCKMSSGSATVSGSIAYFGADGSSQVHAYNLYTEEWSTLPECPTYNFTLSVVNGFLTAVGGRQNAILDHFQVTNTLFSLMQEGEKKNWVDHFPPMPTKREYTAVVCSRKALIVAGGKGEWWTKLTTVEVMDTNTRQWSTVSSLPHPLYSASATICGDRVYLGGGWEVGGYSRKSVFTYSLAENHPAWHTSTELPVTDSTCVTLNGQLVAVGGRDSDGKYTNNIYSYDTETSSWEVISHMPTARCQCLATVLPGNKLMVVGGETYTGDTHKFDITTVV